MTPNGRASVGRGGRHAVQRAGRAICRTAWRATLLLVVASGVADAHAIHTTVTQLTTDGTRMTLRIRAFADDLSASVARRAGRPVPGDHAVGEAELVQYVRSQFLIGGARGQLTLQSCGTRRADDMYWLCFQAPLPEPLRGMSVRNRMLTETHADQINIVQVTDGDARQTLLFRKGSAAALIAARD